MKRELRTKSVGTKVSEAELRVLESRAERAGLTLSEWVRDVLLAALVDGVPESGEVVLAEVEPAGRHLQEQALPFPAARRCLRRP